jgi:hypothetical protein
VYTPGDEGAEKVTGAPEALAIAEKLPPVALQVTPLFIASFTTVADTASGCVTARPVLFGETETARAPTAIVRGSETDFLCCGLLESATLNVSDTLVAGSAGVPVIAPVYAFNASPIGSVPLVRVQVKGSVPPVAASVAA